MEWHRNQSMKNSLRDARLRVPVSPADSISDDMYTYTGRSCLWDCMFVTVGKLSVTQAKLKQLVKAAGGTLLGGSSSIQADKFLTWRGLTGGRFRAIVTTEKALEDEQLCDYIDLRRMVMKNVGRPLPILKEEFLLGCLTKQQFQRIDDYILEPPCITRFTFWNLTKPVSIVVILP